MPLPKNMTSDQVRRLIDAILGAIAEKELEIAEKVREIEWLAAIGNGQRPIALQERARQMQALVDQLKTDMQACKTALESISA